MRRLLAIVLVTSLAGCLPATQSADAPVPSPMPSPLPPLPPPPVPLPPPPAATAGDFRAVGQEPGWFATTASTPRLRLHVEADYGEIVFDASDVRADATGWTGRGPDGVAVTLRFQRMECADGMSGREYPTRTTLTIGERRYSGCGEFAD